MSVHANWKKLSHHYGIPQVLDYAVAKEATFKAAQEATKESAHAAQDTVTASAPLKHSSTAGASNKTETEVYKDFSVTDDSHGTFPCDSLADSNPHYPTDTQDINTNPEGIYEISQGIRIQGDCT
jgi:hypothetical protein